MRHATTIITNISKHLDPALAVFIEGSLLATVLSHLYPITFTQVFRAHGIERSKGLKSFRTARQLIVYRFAAALITAVPHCGDRWRLQSATFAGLPHGGKEREDPSNGKLYMAGGPACMLRTGTPLHELDPDCQRCIIRLLAARDACSLAMSCTRLRALIQEVDIPVMPLISYIFDIRATGNGQALQRRTCSCLLYKLWGMDAPVEACSYSCRACHRTHLQRS